LPAGSSVFRAAYDVSLIAAAHIALMAFTVYRNFARPAAQQRRYAYIPRTSMFIASILRPRRSNGNDRSR